MLNSDFVEFLQALRLTHAGFNEYSIQVFHVGKTNQLIYSSVVSYVAWQRRIVASLLLSSHAKHSHIEHICLIGVDVTGL